jgi:hypothetical protein
MSLSGLKEWIGMIEACFCGRVGRLEDRELIFIDGDHPALRCPRCGQLDSLEWMPASARSTVFANARVPDVAESVHALS